MRPAGAGAGLTDASNQPGLVARSCATGQHARELWASGLQRFPKLPMVNRAPLERADTVREWA